MFSGSLLFQILLQMGKNDVFLQFLANFRPREIVRMQKLCYNNLVILLNSQ